MEPSPLTQQVRPESFQQKIVELYHILFQVFISLNIFATAANESQDEEDADRSEGFWREFFLLKPDKAALENILAECSPDDLLQLQTQTRALFSRAVNEIKAGAAPSDEIALDTLTAFLGEVLAKRYTNPSSDAINVIAGLEDVDAVFTDFVNSLDGIIRNGRTLDVRQKAIEVVLSVTSAAYQTGLVSYFTHRDLFPSLMKFIQDSEVSSRAFEPFVLLGLLANYNKFEFQNPYRLRLEDFVNESTIQKVIRAVGGTCSSLRNDFVAVQDDLPEGWSLTSTLAYIGLGAISPKANAKPQAPSPEAAKALFAALPGPKTAILLATYDFAHANKLFCFNLASLSAETRHGEPPLSSFLSLTSYLLSHSHRSSRTSLYAYLNLLIVRLLVEDQVLCKRMCSDESKISVRLCRQRQPYLPLVRAYHWSELWRALLSLIRFLTSYASDLHSLTNIRTLLDNLVNLIALSLSTGDAFLPSASEYDDLFYKLVETGDVLTKFRDAYDLSKTSPQNSLPTLISVSSHYYTLLQESSQSKTGRSTKSLSPQQVSEVIKSGYETLSITAKDGLDAWDRYREADEKTFLKKMARVAVGDVRHLVGLK
ncbi:MAG: hypothetical protein M1817_002641 [Caeruleum heppii]|nr:MAG: hypothetical protein M1817_002641 [Caeruleum heppii]